MARPLRLEFAGVPYHATPHGDWREAIHEDNADRNEFPALLGEDCGQCNWSCHAYVLVLTRYIVLNPVRTGMVRGVHEWP